MTKLVVAFDLDGVVVDWYGELLRHLPPEIHIPAHQLQHFYVNESYPPEHSDLILSEIKRAGFYDSMKPIKDSVNTLNKIFDDERFFPFLCSSPDVEVDQQVCWSEKARWVSRHLGERWLDRLMLVRDKTLARADVLVDDKPEITGHYESSNPHKWKRFVFTHSYNREVQGVHVNWDNMINHLLSEWHLKDRHTFLAQ